MTAAAQAPASPRPARPGRQVARGKTQLNVALIALDNAISALEAGGYVQQARTLARLRTDLEQVLRRVIDRQTAQGQLDLDAPTPHREVPA